MFTIRTPLLGIAQRSERLAVKGWNAGKEVVIGWQIISRLSCVSVTHNLHCWPEIRALLNNQNKRDCVEVVCSCHANWVLICTQRFKIPLTKLVNIGAWVIDSLLLQVSWLLFLLLIFIKHIYTRILSRSIRVAIINAQFQIPQRRHHQCSKPPNFKAANAATNLT